MSHQRYAEIDDIFGPGTDLILSLAMVLLVLFVVFAAVAERLGLTDLADVRAAQEAVVRSVATQFAPGFATTLAEPSGELPPFMEIPIEIAHVAGRETITVDTQYARQRFTFGSRILFKPNIAELSGQGEEALQRFVLATLPHLAAVEEIKIEGHADPRPPWAVWGDNVNLAAHRAMSVFRLFQAAGIDPDQTLMSVSSFGHHKPLVRVDGRTPFSSVRLEAANDTDAKRADNRRIEIVLVYRYSPSDPQGQR